MSVGLRLWEQLKTVTVGWEFSVWDNVDVSNWSSSKIRLLPVLTYVKKGFEETKDVFVCLCDSPGPTCPSSPETVGPRLGPSRNGRVPEAKRDTYCSFTLYPRNPTERRSTSSEVLRVKCFRLWCTGRRWPVVCPAPFSRPRRLVWSGWRQGRGGKGHRWSERCGWVLLEESDELT